MVLMKVKTLIVGLGNPGSKYAGTRHNAGFMMLDSMCNDFKLEKKFDAEVCEMIDIDSRLRGNDIEGGKKKGFLDSSLREVTRNDKERGEQIVLMKPQTFMNLSGKAVKSFADFYKVSPADIWVVHDDIDIDFGEVRIRENGSSAGHKGVQSIIENLGTENFWRFRIGVKNEKLGQIETEDFVLQRFVSGEENILPEIVEKCAGEIKKSIEEGNPEAKIIEVNR